MAESSRPPTAVPCERENVREPPNFPHIRLKPLAVRELPTRREVPTERREHGSRETLRCRVRAEFEEMRGLRLSIPQAIRLFGLREDVCRRILDALTEDGLLRRTSDEKYGRRDIG